MHLTTLPWDREALQRKQWKEKDRCIKNWGGKALPIPEHTAVHNIGTILALVVWLSR